MSLFRRRLLMVVGGDIPPTPPEPTPQGVTWADYLIGNSSIWIDTQLTWSEDLKIEVHGVAVGTSNGYDYWIDNAFTGRATRWLIDWRGYAKSFEFQSGISAVTVGSLSLGTSTIKNDRLICSVSFDGKTANWYAENTTQGKIASDTRTSSLTGSEPPIRIRSYCSNGTSSYVTRFKAWRGEELIMDMRPCRYNGSPGMWDLVAEEFRGDDSGAGSFDVGFVA